MPTSPRGRRALHQVIGLLTVVTLVTTAAPAGASEASSTASATRSETVDPDARTMIWGATARPRGAEDWTEAIVNLEAKVDRKVAATRVYLLWDSYFPNDLHNWLADTGRLPLISIKPQRSNGTPVRWRDIANAQPGSPIHDQIVTWAQRIKAYGVPVYFTFNHEPEAAASDPNGSDEDFIAAWRKVITVFRNNNVNNAQYLWIMTGWAFWVDPSDHRQAIKWYPGDSYVDAIGSDEYNDFTCRTDHESTWKSLEYEIEPFRQFGRQHPNEELWLPEFGSYEDSRTPGRKGDWMDDVRATFKKDAYSQFRGIVYFHSYRVGTPCTWWVDSSPSSLARFRAMGQDAFYSGRYGNLPLQG